MTGRATSRRPLVLIPTPIEALRLLGSRARTLGRPRAWTVAGRRVDVALTGVGLAAAGATAGRWFAQLRPSAVLLVGVCGTLDRRRLAVGALLEATSIACDGIGAGEGRGFVELPLPPLARTLAGGTRLSTIACVARLAHGVRGALLSVAAAAATPAMVAARRRRHPGHLAEEMEGYAVALAARLAGIELSIVRGVSNVAGDRDPRRWRLDEALAPCRTALETWVGMLPS